MNRVLARIREARSKARAAMRAGVVDLSRVYTSFMALGPGDSKQQTLRILRIKIGTLEVIVEKEFHLAELETAVQDALREEIEEASSISKDEPLALAPSENDIPASSPEGRGGVCPACGLEMFTPGARTCLANDWYRHLGGPCTDLRPTVRHHDSKDRPCPGCGVYVGMHHHRDCMYEKCPICGKARLSCGCKTR